MPKLSKTKRDYALKDIAAGMQNVDLIQKYEISASAVSYLRKMASGETPKELKLKSDVNEFEAQLGFYCPSRILRLAKEEGITPKEIAEDYEVSPVVIVGYLEKVWPTASRTSGKSTRIKLPSRGSNKATKKKRRS